MSVSQATKGAGVQQARSEATRAALIAAARKLFAETGYHATGTNDVVALASVTRGALYHHFVDKLDLFEAVFVQLTDELSQTARASVAPLSGDTWRQLVNAFTAYLRLRAESTEAQRILLIDGPAVLGFERWRELQAPLLDGVAETLVMLMEQGLIARRPPVPLAQLVVAALNDAALTIAHAPDHKAALRESTDALIALIGGLRLAPKPA
jgi:AcrR family transcriptional regulator